MKNMRKFVSLLFVGLLLTSSLIALAGGSDEDFTHTLPEEMVDSAAPLTAPSEGVAPCIDCDHSYDTRHHTVFDQYACFKYKSYTEVYCADCGTFLRTEDVHYGTNSKHKDYGYYNYGDLYQKNGVWYLPTYCPGCGEHLGDTIYTH